MIIKELSLVFRSFMLSFMVIIFTSVSAFTVDLSAGAGLSLFTTNIAFWLCVSQ